ncbi:hypothetical protein [Sulfurimonas sp.]|uniref:hypothetical protein n=1 Tax=Sulfurimonas sp. TaxID=2022749 RepID=UPI003D113447
MTLNKLTILLIALGYYIIYQGGGQLGAYIGLSILSTIMLLGMLFTYLIKKTESLGSTQNQ